MKISDCTWVPKTCSNSGGKCSTNTGCPPCTWESADTCNSNGNSCTSDNDCQPCTWSVGCSTQAAADQAAVDQGAVADQVAVDQVAFSGSYTICDSPSNDFT
jgi:hypothetical protein